MPDEVTFPRPIVMVAPVNCRIVTKTEWLAAGGRETSPLDTNIL